MSKNVAKRNKVCSGLLEKGTPATISYVANDLVTAITIEQLPDACPKISMVS